MIGAHGQKDFTEEEQQRIQAQLQRKLGPEFISRRPGGGGQLHVSIQALEGERICVDNTF